MITRTKPDGTLEVLCCPMTDRTGQAGIAKPDVVGCGSPHLVRAERGGIDCCDCGLYIENERHGEWQPLLTVQVTPQELGTVLAALRFWQKHGPKTPDSFFDRLSKEEQDALNDIRTNCGEFPTDLGIDQIDGLSVRLNGVDPQYLAWRYAGEAAPAGQQPEIIVIKHDEVIVRIEGSHYAISKENAGKFFLDCWKGGDKSITTFDARQIMPNVHEIVMDYDSDWKKENLKDLVQEFTGKDPEDEEDEEDHNSQA